MPYVYLKEVEAEADGSVNVIRVRSEAVEAIKATGMYTEATKEEWNQTFLDRKGVLEGADAELGKDDSSDEEVEIVEPEDAEDSDVEAEDEVPSEAEEDQPREDDVE